MLPTSQTLTQQDSSSQLETGCCPRFSPEPWQEKTFTWDRKRFLKTHVRSVLHIPIGIREMMARELARIEAAGAQSSDRIVLTDERSPWGADYYFAVEKPVDGAEMVELSGTFVTRVFEGPFRNVAEWMASMRRDSELRGQPVSSLYAWYTTCPACAKVYGKNYVVLFAKIHE